ncbi:MAG: insulinase family protein [Candidatus Eremiobacteraeota bacterium]|nr:insulinase family protein [Candidatus Eremiobacteraeota bacterium]
MNTRKRITNKSPGMLPESSRRKEKRAKSSISGFNFIRILTVISILIFSIFLLSIPAHADKYPVKRLKLKNGMTVLLKRIPDSPAVSVCMVYRVGSRNEKPGITGISHLVEHMLYKGTEQYPKNRMGTLLNRIGADFNAFTSNDVSGFYQTVAPEYIDLAVHIEADRMKSGLIGKNELKIEKKITLSEMAGLKNKPSYMLWRQILGTAFTHHPYKWPVQGSEKDIKKINTHQVRWYYKAHYKPKYAVLAIVGKFNEKHVIKLVKKFFNSQVNKAPYPSSVTAVEPPQKGEKVVLMKNKGSIPLLHIAYHSPAIKNRDLYTMAVIDSILTGGRTSWFRKTLVGKGLATTAGSWLDTYKDPGLYYLRFSLKGNTSHKVVENIVFRELEKLKTKKVSEKELQKAKNHLKAQFIKAHGSITNQARFLAWYEAIYTYKYLSDYTRNIDRVKPDDIMRVAKKYFTKKNRTIGRLYPKQRKTENGKGKMDNGKRRTDTGSRFPSLDSHIQACRRDVPVPIKGNRMSDAGCGDIEKFHKSSYLKSLINHRGHRDTDLILSLCSANPETSSGQASAFSALKKTNQSQFQNVEKLGLTGFNIAAKKRYFYNKPKKTTPTKKTTKKTVKKKPKPKSKPVTKLKMYKPSVPVPKPFNLKFKRHKLSNGIVLLIHENSMTPAITMLGCVKSGGMYEPNDKAGLSKITAYMLQRGNEKQTAGQLSEELDRLGVQMAFNSNLQTVDFKIWTMSEHFDRVIPLLSNVLMKPTFPKNHVKKLKSLLLSNLRAIEDRPSIASMKDFFLEVFPQKHPFHHYRWGSRDTLNNITREDVVKFYETYYRPDTTIVAISGNVNTKHVIDVFEKSFKDWKAEGKLPALIIPDVPLPKKTETKINTMEDKSRVDIVMGHKGISRNHPDYYKFHLMNYILGSGTLVTRLGRAVRDKGIAYKINSRLNMSIGQGPWAINLGVKPRNVKRAIRAVKAQVRAMQGHPVTKVELRNARHSKMGALPVYLENDRNIANMLLTIEYYNLGNDYFKKYYKIYKGITKKDIQEVAKKYLHPDKMTVIISGSYKK